MPRLEWSLALISGALAGCLPFGLPPLELTAGGGPIAGENRPTRSMSEASASIRPLAAVGELRDRRFDAGFGFRVEHAPTETQYGPTLEVRGFPITTELTSNGR